MIIYQDAKLTLDLFETDQILFASWPGYENSADFEFAMQALLECLQVHSIPKLLMDARFYQVTTPVATGWMEDLLNNIFPQTQLRKIARLSFPDTALENAIQQVISSNQDQKFINFELGTFQEIASAFAWLRR